jgi:hypothetical protein
MSKEKRQNSSLQNKKRSLSLRRRRSGQQRTKRQTLHFSHFWHVARYIARTSLYVGFGFYVYGTYFAEKFEPKFEIAREVRKAPVQTEIVEHSFPFTYYDKTYRIQPLAEYEISGLIVTHNNISSITDAYHTSKSVDFRDVCVVWGSNVGSGAFQRFKFWSEPWTCYFQTKPGHESASLNEREISNNHLLTNDSAIRKLINSVSIGDQIRLKGKLISYWPEGYSELERRSSMTRSDTGNGACEVMWVEEAEVLKRSKLMWRLSANTGYYLLIGAVLLNIGLFLFTPVKHYKKST